MTDQKITKSWMDKEFFLSIGKIASIKKVIKGELRNEFL